MPICSTFTTVSALFLSPSIFSVLSAQAWPHQLYSTMVKRGISSERRCSQLWCSSQPHQVSALSFTIKAAYTPPHPNFPTSVFTSNKQYCSLIILSWRKLWAPPWRLYPRKSNEEHAKGWNMHLMDSDDALLTPQASADTSSAMYVVRGTLVYNNNTYWSDSLFGQYIFAPVLISLCWSKYLSLETALSILIARDAN